MEEILKNMGNKKAPTKERLKKILINEKQLFYFLFLQVFIPKGRYSGQKPTNDVNKKTIPIINSTKPSVAFTLLVKYNTANTIARIIRTTRSALPIFFFMITVLG
jgi:hypothetical protein